NRAAGQRAKSGTNGARYAPATRRACVDADSYDSWGGEDEAKVRAEELDGGGGMYDRSIASRRTSRPAAKWTPTASDGTDGLLLTVQAPPKLFDEIGFSGGGEDSAVVNEKAESRLARTEEGLRLPVVFVIACLNRLAQA
ncbi:unnamed protein product, partial [Protopolystoma xenopodis]